MGNGKLDSLVEKGESKRICIVLLILANVDEIKSLS